MAYTNLSFKAPLTGVPVQSIDLDGRPGTGILAGALWPWTSTSVIGGLNRHPGQSWCDMEDKMSKWILTVTGPDTFDVEQWPTAYEAHNRGEILVKKDNELSFRIEQAETDLAIFEGLMKGLFGM